MYYTPGMWAVVELTNTEGQSVKKILSAWRGSYLEGSSWRISSGITSIVELEDYYFIENVSGSQYNCYKAYKTEPENLVQAMSQVNRAIDKFGGSWKEVEL